MPVVSPSRYSSATSSSLSSGSYRSTLTSSSSLDKPYYRSSSGTYVSSTLRTGYGDKTTEYRSRYTDIDGKRERKSSLVEYNRTSRAPSISETDSGISTRYRSDRSESRTRDVSTTRSESSKSTADPLARPKRNVISSAALAMSTAELYNKYSPANYIPLSQRIAQAQSNNYGEISRSKSISNDIGRPPASDNGRVTRKPRNSMAGTISERPDPSRWHKEASPSRNFSKRGSMTNGVTDSNGNEVPSVSEIRKRFDQKMTVTKLPTNDTRYSPKSNLDHYINQWKNSENGYTKLSNDDKPVPVHLPSVEKNGRDIKSRSSSDISLSKTVSAPVSLAKPVDKPEMSTSLTTKLPSDRLASIRSQLDPNNPIGKILEKSTVIQVDNGDADYKERKRYVKTNSDSLKPKEKVNDLKTPKHTNSSDIANHKIKIDVNKDPKESHINGRKNKLKYIDTDHSLVLENDIESPSGTGFENQTFEHENFLMKRGNDEVDCKAQEITDRVLVNGDAEKRMDTSTESTTSDLTEDLSDSSSRRNNLEKDFEDSKSELAGGKSGPSGVRRSNDRSISNDDCGTQSCGLNGLRNIGNTCFMNSVLQCMSNTRPLLEYVSDDQYLSDINTTLSCMKGALIKAFTSLIKELWRPGERDSVVNTTTFKSQVQRFAPRFMGYSQQDAQEFLRYLLEGLHEDVNRVTIKPKPILTEIDESLSDSAKAIEAWSRYQRMEDSRVGDIFVGQLKSTLRCTHCRHDSVTFDPFWDLSLPIPSRTGNHKLQQCLQHFTKEEEMDGDEKPTCSKCGVRRKCLKWFTVHKFPQVLVLHLKRFSPTERFRGKLNVVVEFPLNGLDMSPYAAGKGQQAMYNLYAVSNHSGTTYSGHYTAYCKHPYNGEWHEYNDSRVTPISSRNVVSAEAYVLFYELVKTNT